MSRRYRFIFSKFILIKPLEQKMSYQKLSTARRGIKNFKGTRVMKAPMADVVKVLFYPKTLPQ